jgi:uncharacterized phage protein (TIGR02218 family)
MRIEDVATRRRRNSSLKSPIRAAMSGKIGVSGIGFETYETSTFLGDPIELFEFSMGSTFWRWTSSDAAVTYLGNVFATETIVRTPMDFSQEDTAGNITIVVPQTNAVAALFISYVPPNPVGITIYRKHRADPEVVVIFIGKVISCTFDGPEAVLVCAPVRLLLQRRIPTIVFQTQCNWNLYGVGCGINKAAFKDVGTVTSIVGNAILAAVFATRADGWFNNGWIELGSGERRFVVNHVGNTVELMNAFAGLAVGTAFDAYPGCDRTEAVCASKFSNLPRHLGFPRVPTRNPYDGSLI